MKAKELRGKKPCNVRTTWLPQMPQVLPRGLQLSQGLSVPVLGARQGGCKPALKSVPGATAAPGSGLLLSIPVLSRAACPPLPLA